MSEELVPVEKLSYEQARDELVATVGKLESGGVPLEQAMQMWERGEALANRCQQFLDAALVKLQAVRPEGDTAE